MGLGKISDIKHFNSHAHVERDAKVGKSPCLLSNFNSHAHVERDATTLVNSTSKTHFNSHAHVERDVETTPQTADENISTHTLTWSVTKMIHKI